MPPLEVMDRNQRAVLWMKLVGRLGVNMFNEVQTAAPVEIRVRWEEGETDALDDNNQPIRLVGEIVTDQALVIGSVLWLAPDPSEDALDQWYSDGSAGETAELLTVVTKSRGTDLKGRFTRQEYGLARYKGEPPSTA